MLGRGFRRHSPLVFSGTRAAQRRVDRILCAPPAVEGRRSRGRLPEREAILRLAVHAGFLELRGRRTHAELRRRGDRLCQPGGDQSQRHDRSGERTRRRRRSEEHTSELQSLMRISYAVFCLKKKKTKTNRQYTNC